MKRLVLGLSIVCTLLLSGCAFKKNCDARKKQSMQDQHNSQAPVKKTKKLYIGE